MKDQWIEEDHIKWLKENKKYINTLIYYYEFNNSER